MLKADKRMSLKLQTKATLSTSTTVTPFSGDLQSKLYEIPYQIPFASNQHVYMNCNLRAGSLLFLDKKV
jgi:hypothetical protein